MTLGDFDDFIPWAAAILVFLVVIFLLLLPYFRMRTFNKFSHTKATYMDAVLGQLRVVPN